VLSGLGCTSGREANAALRWLAIRAESFVETYWYLIRMVAAELLKRGSLSADDLDVIVSRAGAPPVK
jgi:hypothetical protein